VRFSLGGFEEAQSVNPAAVISRLRRDPDVTADARALLDPIELSWRRDRADRTERIAELCSQIDVGKMMMGGVGGAGPDPTITAIERESVARAEDAQRAYAAIAAAVGPDKSAELFGKRNAMKPDAAGGVQEVEMIFPHQVEAVVPEPEAWHDVPAVLGVAHVNVAPRAWTARELARLYQPLGLPEASLAVLEGVVEGWRARVGREGRADRDCVVRRDVEALLGRGGRQEPARCRGVRQHRRTPPAARRRRVRGRPRPFERAAGRSRPRLRQRRAALPAP
jgi:hypothetical protein